MSRTIVTKVSPEDKVANKYLNKCFQRLLNLVGLKYYYSLDCEDEKRNIHNDRVYVLQKGLLKKSFLSLETVADIKRLPFKEESENLKLEVRVLNPDYLEEIKTVVTEANIYHSVDIMISE